MRFYVCHCEAERQSNYLYSLVIASDRRERGNLILHYINLSMLD